MPRTRRRHHSRSRTRSRSHSCERDRDVKRRKVESYDSSQQKRSLSPTSNHEDVKLGHSESDLAMETILIDSDSKESVMGSVISKNEIEQTDASSLDKESSEESEPDTKLKESETSMLEESTPSKKENAMIQNENETPKSSNKLKSRTSQMFDTKKPLSPRQLEKLEAFQKRKEQREKEREERLKKKQEEHHKKVQLKLEREKEKEEKKQQKLKEIEEKQKEKNLKEEQKRKEKEEKELQKRKEKEEREEQKRKELEEKDKEKQKIAEKKQKAAAAFVNFFTKKVNGPAQASEEVKNEEVQMKFMPFEVKSDMRLAPIIRCKLSEKDKSYLEDILKKQDDTKLYIKELKSGRKGAKCGKTWVFEEDVVFVEETKLGETIVEEKPKPTKMRAKLLKFCDNRRPAYFGTWRKRSKFVNARKPLAKDTDCFDYEIDSDDDWEEEDPGESLHGSDDDKENDSDNEYEVDNEFFVPHGHLSDDEMNDEESKPVSPESHKAKLKLLKNAFEEEMKSRTEKLKPRVIGCIWTNNVQNQVDEAVIKILQPFAMICRGTIDVKKRNDIVLQLSARKAKPGKELDKELVPEFLKFVHGSIRKKRDLVTEFFDAKQLHVVMSKTDLGKQLKKFAEWTKCYEEGPMYKKFCWCVLEDVKKEYGVDLSIAIK